MKSKIGMHVAIGPRDNYGPLAPYLNNVVTFDAGAFDELDSRAVKVFRTHSVSNHKDAPGDLDSLPESSDWKETARFWWSRLKMHYQPVKDKYDDGNLYFQPINEVSNSVNAIAYMEALCEVAHADGYKLALFGSSGGAPSEEKLINKMVPMMKRVQHQEHIYCRHAYSGLIRDNKTLFLTADGLPSDEVLHRPFIESSYMSSVGCTMPMLIGELGWQGAYINLPEGWLPDLMQYNELMNKRSNIIGASLYTAGNWNGKNQFSGQAMIDLKNELTGHDIGWFDQDEIGEPIITPPEEPKHKSVVILLPQDVSQSEVHISNKWGEVSDLIDQNRHTVTQSHDDAKTIVKGGNDESLVISYGNREDIKDYADRFGFNLDIRPRPDLVTAPDPTESNPFAGLRLGQPLGSKWAVTSRFDAPRDYSNGKHEGLDVDVIGTAKDSKVSVLALADGEVIYIEEKRGGYGLHVVMKHTYNGHDYFVIYAHLDQVFTSVGQAQAAGDALGEIGSTGTVTAEHLHLTLILPGHGSHGRYVYDQSLLGNWKLYRVSDSGYYIHDSVDPLPFLPKPPNTLPPVFQQKHNFLNYLAPHGKRHLMDVHLVGRGSFQETYNHIRLNGRDYIVQKDQHERVPSKYEHYIIEDGYFWSNVDTSANDREGYFVRAALGATGLSPRLPLIMQEAQHFQGPSHWVQFFRLSDGKIIPNHQNSGTASNQTTLKRVGDFTSPMTGRIYKDCWVMQASTETQVYQRGTGRIYWSMPNEGYAEYSLDQGNIQDQTPIPFHFATVGF